MNTNRCGEKTVYYSFETPSGQQAHIMPGEITGILPGSSDERTIVCIGNIPVTVEVCSNTSVVFDRLQKLKQMIRGERGWNDFSDE